MPGGNVDAIAVSRSDPNRLYSLLTSPAGERLFRSDDAALNWQAVFTFTAAVTQLAVDPTVTSTVYAGVPDGLLRSVDSGLHWSQVYTIGQEIAVVSPTLIYAAGPIGPAGPNCPFNQLGVARSSDGGTSWQVHGVGCGFSITGLAVSADHPDVVLVSDFGDQTLSRSDDGGQSWHGLLTVSDKFGYIDSLLLDPLDSMRVYAADVYGLSVSPDGGQTWQRTLNIVCCRSVQLAASAGRIYATLGLKSAPPYVVYRSDDGGGTWWTSVEQLPAAPSVLAADPAHTGVLYASPWQYGIYKSISGGGSWSEVDNGIVTPASVPALASAGHGQVFYAARAKPRGGLFHSINGGLTWTEALSDTSLVAVVASRLDPNRAFASTGGEAGVYETSDGKTWTLVLTKPIPDISVDALALAAQDSQPPYFGGQISRQGVVLRRDPGQDGWPVRSLDNTSNVLDLAIDPHNPATLYAGAEGTLKFSGFFRSDDFGVTWQLKDLGGPYLGFKAVAVDAGQTNIVYAGALDDEGVFRSDDRGEHWQGFSVGLPASNPSAYVLVVDELGAPYAGTNNGVYRWDPAQGQWVLFGLAGRTVWSLNIVHGNPEVLLAGTDMGIWEISLPRSQIWLPLTTR